MKNSRESNNISFTERVYLDMFNEGTKKIVSLKNDKVKKLDNISKTKEELKEQKIRLRTLKSNIRFTKRALKKEKRALKRLSKEVTFEEKLMINVTNEYIYGDGYIPPKMLRKRNIKG